MPLLRRHEITTIEDLQQLATGTLVQSIGTPDVYVVGWLIVGLYAPTERVLVDVDDWQVLSGAERSDALPLVVVGHRRSVRDA